MFRCAASKGLRLQQPFIPRVGGDRKATCHGSGFAKARDSADPPELRMHTCAFPLTSGHAGSKRPAAVAVAGWDDGGEDDGPGGGDGGRYDEDMGSFRPPTQPAKAGAAAAGQVQPQGEVVSGGTGICRHANLMRRVRIKHAVICGGIDEDAMLRSACVAVVTDGPFPFHSCAIFLGLP